VLRTTGARLAGVALLGAVVLASLLTSADEGRPTGARSSGGSALEVVSGSPEVRGAFTRAAPVEPTAARPRSTRGAVELRPWLRVVAPPGSSGTVHLRAGLAPTGVRRPAAEGTVSALRGLDRVLPAGTSEVFAGPVGESVELRLVLDQEPLRTIRLRVPADDARPAPRVVDLASQLAAEAAAVRRLRAIAEAQDRFRAARVVDRNGDRDGEYGFLPELVGEGLLTSGDAEGGGGDPLRRAGADDPRGGLTADGYCFRVWLPTYPEPGSGAQRGLPLELAGRGRREIEPLLAARRYVLHAWPIDPGPHALRSFRMDESGTIVARESRPDPDGRVPAALDDGRTTLGDLRDLPGASEDAQPALDGPRWHPIGAWAR
jgi:hypothetical protein